LWTDIGIFAAFDTGMRRFCSKLEGASRYENIVLQRGGWHDSSFRVWSASFVLKFQRSLGAAASNGTTVLAFPTSMSCRIFFTCRNTAQLLTPESHKF